MKTPKLIDLERRRLDLIADARDALRAIEANTVPARAAELEQKHDGLMRDLDLNQLDIDEARMDQEDEERRASRRPPMGGDGDWYCGGEGGLSLRNSGGWADPSGKEIRVLAPGDRFNTERSTGMAFGDAMRAMITGPRNDQERRALSEGTDSAGGYTVPVPLAREFIDRLRAKSCAIRAGARTIPMTSETLAIARLETDPTVTWRLENAEIGTSDPTFARVLLEAKAVAGIVKVSRELLSDSINIGDILTNAFAQAMALELDRVALFNDGGDDGPIGVAATSGINSVTAGANGAGLTSDMMVDAVYEMMLDNAAEPTASIMHPRTAATIAKMKTGDGAPIVFPELIARIPRLVTTAASIAETQGSATAASSILYGDFRHLFIGMRDEMRVEILRERYADYGQIGFLAWMRCDVQLAHKASFSRLKGITV